MNSSHCLNMSLCNNHENNETNISFFNILLNACAKGTCFLWPAKLETSYRGSGGYRGDITPLIAETSSDLLLHTREE